MNWLMASIDHALGRRIPFAVHDGGGQKSQSSFTQQTQQQEGRSESQPNSFAQPFLKGITGNMYDIYTGMEGGNPVGDPSAGTRGFWNGARAQGANGVGGLGGLPQTYAQSVLNGDFLDLSKNPYFQGAMTASLAPATENFVKNIIPGIQSTFASAGRPGSGANQDKINEAMTGFSRASTDAMTKAGNEAYQYERGQQGATLGMLPSLNASQLANLMALGQAGASEDAYTLQRKLGPLDFATRAGMGILGMYPGGATDSSGWSTGSGSSTAMGGGGGGGFGSILGPAMSTAGMAMQFLPMLSDRRDKTDIVDLGTDPLTGLKTYAYRYKGDPKNTPKTVGPMAQDVEKVRPDLVREIGGHKVVAMHALRPRAIDPLTGLALAA